MRELLVRYNDTVIDATATDVIRFGRSRDNEVVLGGDDHSISRRTGKLSFHDDRWVFTNTGSKPIWLVEADGEREVPPDGPAFERQLLHNFAWIRCRGADRDHALIVVIPDHELPQAPLRLRVADAELATTDTAVITLTANEQRTIEAIYEHYLSLPPFYRRQPRSFRSVAVSLGVEQGKVKADHRRVADKAAAAGGPTDGHSDRESLIAWLLTRGLIQFNRHLDERAS